jgi:hypothetical protein
VQYLGRFSEDGVGAALCDDVAKESLLAVVRRQQCDLIRGVPVQQVDNHNDYSQCKLESYPRRRMYWYTATAYSASPRF